MDATKQLKERLREARHPAGEGRRLRRRRRPARQVRRARQVLGRRSRSGIGFCDVIFGWDTADVLYDNARVTGWHTGYPDTHARIDPATFRVLPWEPDTAAFLLDFVARRTARRTRRARAACSSASSPARRALGLRAASSARSSSSSSSRRRRRRSTRRASAASSRSRRGCSATRGCARARTRELCHAILDDMDALRHPHRGPPHRDRPGRLRGRHPLRRGAARGRQGGALQDGDEAGRRRASATR